MKINLLLILFCLSIAAYAQPDKDDDVVYFTDAQVNRSRFKVAAIVNPNYTDRRLINDEFPSGGGYDLQNTDASGSFQLNYNVDLFYALGSSLHVGIGLGRSGASYEVDEVIFYQNRVANDTVFAKLAVDVGMITVPIKFNFNTSVTDLWDLEIVPAVELNFFDSYNQVITPLGEASVTTDLSDKVQTLNYSASLSLGGTYRLTDSWGLIMRANVRYLLKPIIEETNFPRETIYNFGANIGLSYKL